MVLTELMKPPTQMDQTKGMNGADLAQPKADELVKCLEENKGDNTKCKDKVEAFRSSSSSSSSSHRKPLTPIKLRSGSLTDV